MHSWLPLSLLQCITYTCLNMHVTVVLGTQYSVGVKQVWVHDLQQPVNECSDPECVLC